MTRNKKRKSGIDWNAIKSDWKKQVFLAMLIIFLPSVIYLLGTGKFFYFFLLAAVFYGLIQYIKSK